MNRRSRIRGLIRTVDHDGNDLGQTKAIGVLEGGDLAQRAQLGVVRGLIERRSGVGIGIDQLELQVVALRGHKDGDGAGVILVARSQCATERNKAREPEEHTGRP